MKASLLIFGASGRLATELCGYLSRDYSLIRFTSKTEELCKHNKIFSYDINEPNQEVRFADLNSVLVNHHGATAAIFFSGGSLPSPVFDRPNRRADVFRLNVESSLEVVDRILSIGIFCPFRFIFISSTAVLDSESSGDYSASKLYLEHCFKGYSRRFAATSFSFSCLRLGYVATRERFHEKMRLDNYSAYIEFLAKSNPNLVPLSIQDVHESLNFILNARAHVANGLFLNLSGGNL